MEKPKFPYKKMLKNKNIFIFLLAEKIIIIFARQKKNYYYFCATNKTLMLSVMTFIEKLKVFFEKYFGVI